MSIQLITFITALGLAALAALFGLWRHERYRVDEAQAELKLTRDALAIARDTLAVRTEEYDRYRRWAQQLARQREQDEDAILSAPAEDDGPLAPVLAETLDRHRDRSASNADADGAAR